MPLLIGLQFVCCTRVLIPRWPPGNAYVPSPWLPNLNKSWILRIRRRVGHQQGPACMQCACVEAQAGERLGKPYEPKLPYEQRVNNEVVPDGFVRAWEGGREEENVCDADTKCTNRGAAACGKHNQAHIAVLGPYRLPTSNVPVVPFHSSTPTPTRGLSRGAADIGKRGGSRCTTAKATIVRQLVGSLQRTYAKSYAISDHRAWCSKEPASHTLLIAT